MPKADVIGSIKYPPGCKEIQEDLAIDDLVRRLKDIAMAFQQMSQEDDNSPYINLAKFLATDYFLEHNSRDVRLLVACGIADVFRVYAPNAPYQETELIKKIFLFFIQQLRGLQDPKDAIFKRYFYLLENLAWVKSFNICIELEESQMIFCQLFSLIFKIVNDNHSEKVKNFMLDMLTPLIVEADTVSQKLIEIILWQIIEPKKSYQKQAAWLATQIIKKTNKTMEPYLITYFNQAITHGVNENAGELSDDDDDDDMMITGRIGMKKKRPHQHQASVTQLCELIYELNQICPSVMEGVLPQLEFKIRSNEEKERCEFTKLLARLFSDKNSNLAEQYPELWKSFLGRFRDIAVLVRTRCVQYSMHFLVNHPELRNDVSDQLRQRQHDPDENVRYEVVMAIISAAKKGIEHVNEDLLSYVKERTLDKKFKIRREALLGLAQLYKLNNVASLDATDPDELETNVAASLRVLNWVKNKCLHNYFQTQLDDRLLVERILHTCLIPFSLPLPERMKVLYTFYCTIDTHASRAFNELLKQQLGVRKQVKEILDLLREEKTEDRDYNIKVKISALAKNLPEPVKAEEYITKLCRNLETNANLRQHMESLVTSTSYLQIGDDGNIVPPPPCSQLELSAKEVLKSLGFPVQTNSFYVIIKHLMERIAPVMVDHQGLIMLFDYVSDSLLNEGEIDIQLGIQNSARRGLQLILSLSSVFPAIFYGKEIFTDYLLPFLWQSGDHPEVGEIVLQILTNIGSSAGSYKLEGSSGESASSGVSSLASVPWWASDEDIIPKIVEMFIEKPSSTRQSKYAIQCLNAIIRDENDRRKIFNEIVDKVREAGMSLESPFFRNHLVTLGMIATCGGHIYFPKLIRSIVQKYVVQELLLNDQRLAEEIAVQEESEKNRNSSDSALTYDLCSEEVKSKVEGIKLMVRWLYGLKQNTLRADQDNLNEATAQYQKSCANTLQLLKTMILNQGDLNENGTAGTTLEKAHLRLAAGIAMLKIVANDAMITVNTNNGEATVYSTSATSTVLNPSQWHILATLLIDSEDFVREKFVLKLHKGLSSMALGLEFLAILCLGGTFEGTSPLKQKLRSYLAANLLKRRDIVKSKSAVNLKAVMPDCVMPYVIHLLAHMPFYTQYDDISQLEIIKNCLWFIMDPLVLKNEHYSFSFYKRTFENIKTCVDRVSAAASNAESNGNGSVPSNLTPTNYKIYCACDLALGLVMSKTQNFLLKDFPVQPSLPGKYYMVSPLAADNNQKCYLPPEMQFAPPKRCGLEAEVLGKITRSFNQQQSQKKRAPNSPIVLYSGDAVEDEMIIEQENAGETTTVVPNSSNIVRTSTPIKTVRHQQVVVKQDVGDEEEVAEAEVVTSDPPTKKKRTESESSGTTASSRPTRASARGKQQETLSEGESEIEASGGDEQSSPGTKRTRVGDEDQAPTRKSSRVSKSIPLEPRAAEATTAATRSTRSRGKK